MVKDGVANTEPGIKYSYKTTLTFSTQSRQDEWFARELGFADGQIPDKLRRITFQLTDDGILIIQSPLFGGGHAGLNRLAVYGRNPTEIQHELYELRKVKEFAQELHKQGLVHYEPGVPLGDCLRNFLKNLTSKKNVSGDVVAKIDRAIGAVLGENEGIEISEKAKKEFGNDETLAKIQEYKIHLFLQAIHANAQKFFPVNDEPADNAKTIFLSSGSPKGSDAASGPVNSTIVKVYSLLAADQSNDRRAAAEIVRALSENKEGEYLPDAGSAVSILLNVNSGKDRDVFGLACKEVADRLAAFNGQLPSPSADRDFAQTVAAALRLARAQRLVDGPSETGATDGVGGITETGLTIETKGDGARIPLFKNVPLRAENFPGFDFTIDGLKRNQTAAQVVL